MKRKISSAILVVLLISLTIILGSVRKVPAKSGCSDSSLRGSYGLHATGTVLGVGPFAAVGVFSFNGAGSLTGTLFPRVNGNNIGPLTLKGTYTVSPDCTVSDSWHFSDGSSSQHESVIVDGGRGYLILNTTVGDPSVISGEAHKQFRGDHDED